MESLAWTFLIGIFCSTYYTISEVHSCSCINSSFWMDIWVVSSLGFYKWSLFSNFHHLSLCQTLLPQDTKVAETLQLRVGCLPSPSPWSPSLPCGSRTLQKPNLHQQGHRGSRSCVELSPRNRTPLLFPSHSRPWYSHRTRIGATSHGEKKLRGW